MIIEVIISYDDRTQQVGSKPLFYHREAIGVTGNKEVSILPHVYPNPEILHELVINFPFKPNNIVCKVRTENNDHLVAPNKRTLSKIGNELVKEAKIEESIRAVFDGAETSNPVMKHLRSDSFAKLEFNYEEGELSFESGTIRQIHKAVPKGLAFKPPIKIEL